MHLLALIISSFTLLGIAKRCNNPVLRKEIRELNSEETQRFAKAINQLHATPRPGTNLSEYEYFSYVHDQYQEHAHLLPTFLPWHRYFIRIWEKELQKIDDKIVLPYWDWTLDSQAPELSSILTAELFGGDGNPENDFCVNDGLFANWTLKYPNSHCLRRSYDRMNSVSPFSYPEEILLYLNEPKFSDFSFKFEDVHSFPHINIGGLKGDFIHMWSPNDPLFFLHHTFVDMIWTKWQALHPEANQYDGAAHNVDVCLSDTLIPYTEITIESTLDTLDDFYCYEYPDFPRIINVQSKHEETIKLLLKDNPFLTGGHLYGKTTVQAIKLLQDLVYKSKINATKYTPKYKIEIPGPFSDQWIIDLGLIFDHFRKTTDHSATLASLLNQLPGFTSIAHYKNLLT